MDNDITGFPHLGQDGYYDVMDELAEQSRLINTQLAVQRYEYAVDFRHQAEAVGQAAIGTSFADIGDEFYGGSTFAFIPTEVQIASAVALMNRNMPTEGPVYIDDPGMNSLVAGIYKNAQDFWRELAQANQTGW